VDHPAVTEIKGISDVHRLYEHSMAEHKGVTVSAAYLFEDGGLVSQSKEGGLMPLTPEQLAEFGVRTEGELKAKLGQADRVEAAEKDSADKTRELEAAHDRIRAGAAEGFIATNREKFPPALDDHFRAVHMGLTRAEGPVEFARPAKDGATQTVKLDPVASLAKIVGSFGKAVELQDEHAPEGGKDQEHMTDEEKEAARLAKEKKAKEDKEAEGDDEPPVEGKTDEVVELARGGGRIGRSKMARDQSALAAHIVERDGVELGTAMGMAAVELARAGYGSDAYVPPAGLKKDDEGK